MQGFFFFVVGNGQCLLGSLCFVTSLFPLCWALKRTGSLCSVLRYFLSPPVTGRSSWLLSVTNVTSCSRSGSNFTQSEVCILGCILPAKGACHWLGFPNIDCDPSETTSWLETTLLLQPQHLQCLLLQDSLQCSPEPNRFGWWHITPLTEPGLITQCECGISSGWDNQSGIFHVKQIPKQPVNRGTSCMLSRLDTSIEST